MLHVALCLILHVVVVFSELGRQFSHGRQIVRHDSAGDDLINHGGLRGLFLRGVHFKGVVRGVTYRPAVLLVENHRERIVRFLRAASHFVHFHVLVLVNECSRRLVFKALNCTYGLQVLPWVDFVEAFDAVGRWIVSHHLAAVRLRFYRLVLLRRIGIGEQFRREPSI